jgi:probable phosphoglycerate mutase
MPNTTIDLIRHGEPVGGRAYRGHTIDDPLSEKGWQQMWEGVGKQTPWQQIITSPLIRCAEFANALANTHTIPINVEPAFREVGFGEWEGKTPDQIRQENPQQYEAFYQDPINARPPGAEPLDSFIERVITAYQDVISRYQGQHLLIVAHAGVIRAITAHVLYAAPIGMYRIKVKNGHITRIQHDPIGGHLLFQNCLLS